MKAFINKDWTVRTIHIEIEPGSVPDLDVSQAWHKRVRQIRPDLAILTIADSIPSFIEVSGKLVLVNGSISPGDNATRDSRKWWGDNSWREKIGEAPEWVQRLWREAPSQVGSWQDPEVQPL